MTQEDKELLLKDLCARLPHGVKGIITYDKSNTIFTVEGIDNNVLHLSDTEECYFEDFKPYLRPMSSMTEEEKVQLSQYACIGEDLNGEFIDEVQRKDCTAYIDWLNKNHFDYRGLIEKGFALEAPEGIYNNYGNNNN